MAAVQAGASRPAAASIPASTLRRCSRLKAERKQKFPVDPRKPAQLHLAQPADFLQPADPGFDELADLEARRVAPVARGARIDGRTAGPGGVLRHMRGDVLVTQAGDEFCRVIRLVRPQGLSASPGSAPTIWPPPPARRCRWPA